MKLFKRIFSIILVFLFTFCLLFDLSSVNAYAGMYGTVNGNEVTKQEFFDEIFKYRPEEHFDQPKPYLWPEYDEPSGQCLFDGKTLDQLPLMDRIVAQNNISTAFEDSTKLDFFSYSWKQIGKVTNELSVGNGSGQLVPSYASHHKVDPVTGLYEYELPSSGAGSAALGIGALGAYIGGKALGVMRKDDFSSELFQQMRDDLHNEASESWTAQDYQTAIQKYMEGAGYGLLALVDDGADGGDPIFLAAEALFAEQLKALSQEKVDLSTYYENNPAPEYEWDGKVASKTELMPLKMSWTTYGEYSVGSTKYYAKHNTYCPNLNPPYVFEGYRLCLAPSSDPPYDFGYTYKYSFDVHFWNPEKNRCSYEVYVHENALNPIKNDGSGFYTYHLGHFNDKLVVPGSLAINCPVFNTHAEAVAYCENGIIGDAINDPSKKEDPKYNACPLPVAQPEYCPQLQPYTPYTATDLLDYFDAVNEAHEDAVADPAFNPTTDPVTLPQPITAPVAQPYPTIVKDPSTGTGTVTNPDPEVDPDPETSPSGNLINIPDWMDPDAEFGDLEADAGILKEVFPFCVPHDILLAFQTFGSSGTDTQINTQNVRIYSANKVSAAEYKPVFLFPLEFDVFGETVSYDLRIDITEGAESFIEWFKWFQVILFAFGLMKLSFKISHTF